MNYILHFQPRSPGSTITQPRIKEFFKDRPGYTVNDYQALYSNEDTGVFFTFEYGGRPAPEAARSDILPVYFNLAAGKAHIFALEAETELAEFIRTFELLVSDTAMKGGGYREYAEMEFYRGFTAVNEAFYRDLAGSGGLSELATLPFELIEKCWRWNYHVPEMHAELGETVFVPRVMLLKNRSACSTAVVWTDAKAVILPRVEKVILYRREISHGFHLGKKEDLAVVDFSALEPLLKDYTPQKEHLEYFNLIYQDPPVEIRHFFQTQKSVPGDSLRFVLFSQVHDRELIAKISGRSA